MKRNPEQNNGKASKVAQIVPASGYDAIYTDIEHNYVRTRVLAWALLDGDITGMVVGKDAALIAAASVPRFSCYAERGQDVDEDAWQLFLYSFPDDDEQPVALHVAAGGRP